MINIGILGGADIAYRMFLPSLIGEPRFNCVGVATSSKEKGGKFSQTFGVKIFDNYDEIINNKNVDAVYIPLPPALHYKWAKKALENNKNVFLEKPSTCSYNETEELVNLAKNKNLVLQENYMFQYHSQLNEIKEIIRNGIIGDIRLIKISFGFPLRGKDDFRYNKELGGGALLDEGGYAVKLATIMLGDTIELQSASKNMIKDFTVDMFGTASFINKNGLVCQCSYGMDCYYQCSLEIWGNRGKLHTNRIFTAPPGYEPKIVIERDNAQNECILKEDNHFRKSIDMFKSALEDNNIREKMLSDMLKQSELISKINDYTGAYNDKI